MWQNSASPGRGKFYLREVTLRPNRKSHNHNRCKVSSRLLLLHMTGDNKPSKSVCVCVSAGGHCNITHLQPSNWVDYTSTVMIITHTYTVHLRPPRLSSSSDLRDRLTPPVLLLTLCAVVCLAVDSVCIVFSRLRGYRHCCTG